MARRCSRPGCKQDAVYTLTYVYRDSTAVVGPLAAYTEPHCYDLCEGHAGRLTAPLGWDVVRLPVHEEVRMSCMITTDGAPVSRAKPAPIASATASSSSSGTIPLMS